MHTAIATDPVCFKQQIDAGYYCSTCLYRHLRRPPHASQRVTLPTFSALVPHRQLRAKKKWSDSAENISLLSPVGASVQGEELFWLTRWAVSMPVEHAPSTIS